MQVRNSIEMMGMVERFGVQLGWMDGYAAA
jgi:hypothetical protein